MLSSVEAILDAVSLVPTGRVVSYGDIAELVGTSPRRVGTVMSQVGSSVAWWRVTNARGAMPPHLTSEAVRRWRGEGIPLSSDGERCQLSACRADLQGLAAALERDRS